MKKGKRLYDYGSMVVLKSPPHNEMDTLYRSDCVYNVAFDPREFGVFLQKTVSFTLPPKIYGSSDSYLIDKVLKTFKATNKSLGVLLSGYKGTGKTVTAKQLAINSGLPIIKISNSFGSEVLSAVIKFLLEMPEPYVLFIDEFEKLFNEEEQAQFLPFLDGFSITPVLTILTVNDKKINHFLLNRLQRIRYHKEYSFLTKDVIDEIVDDLLDKKYSYLSRKIVDSLLINRIATMDIVVSLIQEVNIHGEAALTDLQLLNVSTEAFSVYSEYFCTCYNKTNKILFDKIPGIQTVTGSLSGNQLNHVINGSKHVAIPLAVQFVCRDTPFSICVNYSVEDIGISDSDLTGTTMKLVCVPNNLEIELAHNLLAFEGIEGERLSFYTGFSDEGEMSYERVLNLWIKRMAKIYGDESFSDINTIRSHRHYGPLISTLERVFEISVVDYKNNEITFNSADLPRRKLVF